MKRNSKLKLMIGVGTTGFLIALLSGHPSSAQVVTPQDTFNAPSKTLTPGKIRVESAGFGIYLDDQFIETSKVPLKVGQAYGWKIKLKDADSDAKIKFKEEFTLPSAPKKWGDARGAISKDQTTCVTEKEVKPKNGWISHAWDVAEGDPEGKYVMKVFVNDVLTKTFKFKVTIVSDSAKHSDSVSSGDSY